MSIYPEYTITFGDLADLAQAAGINPKRFYTHTLPAGQGTCLAIDMTPAEADSLAEQAGQMFGQNPGTEALADTIGRPHRDPHKQNRHFWPLLTLRSS